MQFSNPGSLPSTITVSGGTITNVTNPVSVTGNVTPDPTSTIANVTTFVPTLTRDLYFWPGVNGEAFPPTRAAVCTYSFRATKAAYKLTAGAGSGVQLTFPNVSRTPYDTTKKTVTFQWKHNQANTYLTASQGFSYTFGYGITTARTATPPNQTFAQQGIGWGIYLNASDAKWHFLISDGVSNKQDIALTTVASYALNTWHVWQVSVTDTACIISLDGVVVGTTTQGWSNTSATDPQALSFYWAFDANEENGSTNNSFTELLITYST